WQRNEVRDQVTISGRAAYQGIAYDVVSQRPIVTALVQPDRSHPLSATVQALDAKGAQIIASNLGAQAAGNLGVSAEGGVAAVPLTLEDAVAILDWPSGKLRAKVKTGIAPFAVVLNARGTVAYVSNWGGRPPQPGEPSAPTGSTQAKPDQVLVDP